MNLRSLLLIGCMLVVPLLALFSHLVPPEFRAATRRCVAAAVGRWSATPAASDRPPASVELQPPANGPARDRLFSTAAVGFEPAAVPAASEPAAPPLVAQLADRTRQIRDQQARDHQATEAQLNALGAVSFECQPLPGSGGLHSSSCRVPVDAAGQLQRVFQATGPDPNSASSALLAQVAAWRQRQTVQPTSAATGIMASGDAAAGSRFR